MGQVQPDSKRAKVVEIRCLQPNCTWTTTRTRSNDVIDHLDSEHEHEFPDITKLEYQRYISILERFFLLDQHAAWASALGRPRTRHFERGREKVEREKAGICFTPKEPTPFPTIWVSPLQVL